MLTKLRRILLGAGLGALTSLPVISLSYLANALFDLPFVAFDIFDWVARTLPGGLITFGIDSMVSVIRGLNLGETDTIAKATEQLMAILQLVFGGAAFGALLTLSAPSDERQAMRRGLLGGALLLLVTVVIEAALGAPNAGWTLTILWLSVLFLSWGALLGRSVAEITVDTEEMAAGEVTRRSFLQMVSGGSVAAALVSLGIASLLERSEPGGSEFAASDIDIDETTGPAASPPQDVLDARIEPAPGTRPEVTANEDFYRIDINTSPPRVDASSWTMSLAGMVDNPLELTIEDLLNRPSATQVVTMQCISNPIGGDLTSSSRWTGIQFRELLAEAGIQDGAREVYIESADGFYESVALEVAMDPRVLLVYAMNGVPLPVEHGFPLRIYIPNRYGMKQPKWIMSMEVIGEEGAGYWVDRGWSEEALVRTTSVVDTVAADHMDPDTGMVPVGGIAWAGSQGISRVEVQVDEGSWVEAQLRQPPVSPLTWVQWRYDWPFQEGDHTFSVRAYDSNGDLQILEKGPPRPDGATGIHTFRYRG
jgi:DMSO/TMAO reductase YedYZ molybdopterin-dependent catalytic subunit